MLVLGRKLPEETSVTKSAAKPTSSDVVLTMADGNQVVLRVIEIRGNTIRLGVMAPEDVYIFRGELFFAYSDSDHGRDRRYHSTLDEGKKYVSDHYWSTFDYDGNELKTEDDVVTALQRHMRDSKTA